MKIFSNNISTSNNITKPNSIQFGNNIGEQKRIPQGISHVTPDFNVSTPISYSHIEDIKLPNNLTAHYYKLANGQKVVIVPKDGETVVKTYVNTGSLNEPDKLRGISHYIEHNLFNGSDALGDKVFFNEVHNMGAVTNASTSFSETDYFVASQLLDSKDLEESIKLHAGMLQTPKFLQEKLDKEKKIVNSEINMCLSDESSRAITTTIKNLFNIKSTSPDLIAGSTDNIDALTREDVVNYFNNNYYPANMVTVITGEVEPNQTMKLISKYFNSKKAPSQNRYYEKMVPTEKPVRQDMISSKNTGAAEIKIGFAGPENNNSKDIVHMRAINQLLLGLANARMKDLEQKYSTSILHSSERIGSRPQDRRVEMFEAAVPEAYVEPLLKDFYNTINNISNYPPTREEFEAVKNQIKKVNSQSLQMSIALNRHIGMDFLNGTPHHTAEYASIIDNMTYEDFVNTAKKYYDLNKVAITVVHPKGTQKENIQKNYESTKSNNITFTGINKKTPVDTNKISEYKTVNNFNVDFQDDDNDIINYNIDISSNKWIGKNIVVADVLNEMFQYSGSLQHSYKDLALISDRNGISSGIGVSAKGLGLSADFSADKIDTALNIFREKLQYPNLNQDLFNLAVKHCKDAYSTKEPNAFDKYGKTMYKNTPISVTEQEKLEMLSKVTLQDVIGLYNDILTKGEGQVTVTGPFGKHPELKQAILNNTACYYPVQSKDFALNKTYTPIEKTEIHTTETHRNQAEIIQGFKYKVSGNVKDSVCLQILNTILGGSSSSRLFSDLREKRHLAYDIYSDYSSIDDMGIMTLYIKTTTNNTETGAKTLDNIQKSIDGFNENIQRISTEKISEKELESAKKALKNGILTGLETSGDKNSILSSNLRNPYGAHYVNEKLAIVDSITPEDILNTAKNVFKGKPIYSIAATKEALEANKEYLNNICN